MANLTLSEKRKQRNTGNQAAGESSGGLSLSLAQRRALQDAGLMYKTDETEQAGPSAQQDYWLRRTQDVRDSMLARQQDAKQTAQEKARTVIGNRIGAGEAGQPATLVSPDRIAPLGGREDLLPSAEETDALLLDAMGFMEAHKDDGKPQDNPLTATRPSLFVSQAQPKPVPQSRRVGAGEIATTDEQREAERQARMRELYDSVYSPEDRARIDEQNAQIDKEMEDWWAEVDRSGEEIRQRNPEYIYSNLDLEKITQDPDYMRKVQAGREDPNNRVVAAIRKQAEGQDYRDALAKKGITAEWAQRNAMQRVGQFMPDYAGYTEASDKGYNQMTKDQRDMYAYLLAEYGPKIADRYLNDISDELLAAEAQHRVEDEAKPTGNAYLDSGFSKFFRTAGHAVEAGVVQPITGWKRFVSQVTGNTSHQPGDISEFVSEYTKEKLDGIGRVGYDILQTTASQWPQLLTGGILQGGKIATLAPLGIQVAGNAYDQGRQNGLDQTNAQLYAFLEAGTEIITEMIGGVGFLSGGTLTEEAAENIVKSIGNDLLRMAASIGLDMTGEGVEEIVSGMLDPLWERLTGNKEATWDAKEILYEGALGALSGGLMGAPVQVSKYVSETNAARAMKATVKGMRTASDKAAVIKEGMIAYGIDEATADETADIAARMIAGEDIGEENMMKLVKDEDLVMFVSQLTEEVAKDSKQAGKNVIKNDMLDNLLKVADSMDAKSAAAKTAKAIRALQDRVREYEAEQETEEAKRPEKPGLPTEQQYEQQEQAATEAAPSSANVGEGEQARQKPRLKTKEQLEAQARKLKEKLAKPRKDIPDLKERITALTDELYRNIVREGTEEQIGEARDAAMEPERYAERRARDAAGKAADAVKKAATTEEKAQVIRQALSDAGITGERADTIANASLKVGSGELIDDKTMTDIAKDNVAAAFASAINETMADNDTEGANRAVALNYASRFGEDGADFLNTYAKGEYKQDATDFYNEYTEIYTDAKNGIITAPGETTVLTEAQAREAFNTGLASGRKATQNQQNAVNAGRNRAAAATVRGQVNTDAIKGIALSAAQQNTVDAATPIAKALGVNITWYASETVNGKRTGQNGYYDPKTNTIHLDIYAGSNSQQDLNFAAMRTLSHEITHYIQQWSPSKYAELRDAMFSALRNNGQNLEDLVKQKQANAQAQGLSLTRAMAADEVVADACEMMLKDSTIIENLAKRDMNLAKRIGDTIKNFAKKIKAAFQGIKAQHAEAKALIRNVNGIERYIDGLQKAWDDALEAAAKANQQLSERTIAGGTVITEAAETIAEKGGPLVLTTKEVQALNKAVRGVNGVTIDGVPLNNAMRKSGDMTEARQLSVLDELGKRYGYEIVVHDTIKSGALEGVYISGKAIHIARDAKAGALLAVGVHETVHMMRMADDNAYLHLADAVRGVVGTTLDWNDTVQARAKADGVTLQEAEEEIVAEAVPAIYTEKEAIADLIMKYPVEAKLFANKMKDYAEELRRIYEERGAWHKHPEIKGMLDATADQIDEIYQNFQAGMEIFKARAASIDYTAAITDNGTTGLSAKYSKATAPKQIKDMAERAEMFGTKKAYTAAEKAALKKINDRLKGDAKRNGTPYKARRSMPIAKQADVTDAEMREAMQANAEATRALEDFIQQAKDDKFAWMALNGGSTNDLTGGMGPLRNNIEYIYSFDPDTKCYRADNYGDYVQRIENRMGRKMTARETQNLLQLMVQYGQMIPCRYCYLYTKRALLDESYQKKVMEAMGGNVADIGIRDKNGHQITAPEVERVFREVEATRRAVFNWMDENYALKDSYIYDDDLKINHYILPTWYGKKTVKSKNETTNPYTEDRFIQEVGEHFGFNMYTTSESGKETKTKTYTFVKGLVGEWLDDAYNDVAHNIDESATPIDKKTGKRMLTMPENWKPDMNLIDIHSAALASAKSGIKANLPKAYAPYNGDINSISGQDMINIIAHDGLRFQSSTDFRVKNTLDYIQIIADMAAFYKSFYIEQDGKLVRKDIKGLNGHMYTKDPRCAFILAPSGLHINCSVAFNGNKAGEITFNIQEGMDPYAGIKQADVAEYVKTVTDLADKQGNRKMTIGALLEANQEDAKLREAVDQFRNEQNDVKQMTVEDFYNRFKSGRSLNILDLAERHKNVGLMAMVTNDAQLAYAVELYKQGKIHMIIPFHRSGLSTEFIEDMMNWTDYERVQLESDMSRDELLEAIRDAKAKDPSVVVPAGNCNYETALEAYGKYVAGTGFKQIFVASKVKGADGTESVVPVRKVPHFLPGECIVEGIDPETGATRNYTIPGHHNDYDTYIRLCREYAINPRFYKVELKGEDGTYHKLVDDKKGYMAVIHESRKDAPMDEKTGYSMPVKAEFDTDLAVQLLHNEYYDQNKAIQQAVDSFGLVDTFMETLAGEKRGLLTESIARVRKKMGIDIDPDKFFTMPEAQMYRIADSVLQMKEGIKLSPAETQMWEEVRERTEDAYLDDLAEKRKGGEVRFSMRESVEEGRTLIAIHEINTDQLKSALDTFEQGLPSPSIGILDIRKPVNTFGDVSLVYDKRSIAPDNYDSDKGKNYVLSGDAWTTSTPQSEEYDGKKYIKGTVHWDPFENKMTGIEYNEDNIVFYEFMDDDEPGTRSKSARMALGSAFAQSFTTLQSVQAARGRIDIDKGHKSALAIPKGEVTESEMRQRLEKMAEKYVGYVRDNRNMNQDEVMENWNKIQHLLNAMVHSLDNDLTVWNTTDENGNYEIFDDEDYARNVIAEELGKEGINVEPDDELPGEIFQYLEDWWKNFKVSYFEHKRKGIVNWDEAKYAVIPQKTEAEIGDRLRDKGILTVTYTDTEDRIRKIQELDDRYAEDYAEEIRREADEDTYFSRVYYEDGKLLFQPRQEDEMSDREMLARALSTAATNSEERRALAEYREKINDLDSIQAQAENLHKQMMQKGITREERAAYQAKYLAQMKKLWEADKGLLRMEATKPLRNVMEQEKKEAAAQAAENSAKRMEAFEARQEERLQKQRQQAEMWKQRYQDERAELANWRKDPEGYVNRQKMENRIRSRIKRLNDALLFPKSTSFVPDELKKPVAELLRTFTDTKSVFNAEQIQHIQGAYADIFGGKNPTSQMLYSQDIEDALTELRETVSGKTLYRLTRKELNDISDIVDYFIHLVEDYDTGFVNGRKASISALGDKVRSETRIKGDKKEYAKALETVKDFMTKGNATPVYFFKWMGGTMNDLFNSLMKGEKTWAQTMESAEGYMKRTMERYHYWDWNDKKGDTLKFKTSFGEEIELTRDVALGIWATRMREVANHEQQASHLETGGFVYENAVSQKKEGKLFKYTVNTKETHRLNGDDISRITDWLTDEQKEYATAMIRYMSVDMSKLGNEVSKALYGYEKFKESFYYPYKSSRDYMETDLGQKGEESPMLRNASFTKRLTRYANNPIVARNFTEVVAEHVASMINFYSFGIQQDTFMRVFNDKSKVATAEGPEKDSVKSTTTRSVLSTTYGKAAINYITDFMSNLYGGAQSGYGAGMLNKLTSAFKKASVFANASVVVQQPSAIMRAMAMVDPKYFVKSSFTSRKKALEEMMKYSGTAIIKRMGRFDMNSGRSAVQYLTDRGTEGMSAKERVKGVFGRDSAVRDDLLSIGAEKADEITWAHLWNAVKAEVKATMPDFLMENEELFLQTVGDRFDDVVHRTQVYDSVFARSALMRSPDTGVKMVTAFMSEPTLSTNMLLDAVMDARAGKVKNAGRIVGALVGNVILNSILKALVQAARDDDENETYIEKYLGAVVGNLAGQPMGQKNVLGTAAGILSSDLSPISNIPLAQDIINIFLGYSVDRSDMTVISDLKKNLDKMLAADGDTYGAAKAFASTLGMLTGVPVKNIWRDMEAAYNVVESDRIANTNQSGILYAILTELGRSDSKTNNYKELLQHIANKNVWGEEMLRQHIAELDIPEKTVVAGLKNQLKTAYTEGKYTGQQAKDLLARITNEPAGTEAAKTVRNWDTTAATDSSSPYSLVWKHIEDWNGKELKQEIKELKNLGYTDSGITSSITAHFKDEYVAASKSQRATLKQHLIEAYKLVGYTQEKAAAKIDKWLED